MCGGEVTVCVEPEADFSPVHLTEGMWCGNGALSHTVTPSSVTSISFQMHEVPLSCLPLLSSCRLCGLRLQILTGQPFTGSLVCFPQGLGCATLDIYYGNCLVLFHVGL